MNGRHPDSLSVLVRRYLPSFSSLISSSLPPESPTRLWSLPSPPLTASRSPRPSPPAVIAAPPLPSPRRHLRFKGSPARSPFSDRRDGGGWGSGYLSLPLPIVTLFFSSKAASSCLFLCKPNSFMYVEKPGICLDGWKWNSKRFKSV